MPTARLNTQSNLAEVEQALMRRGLPLYMADGLWMYLTQGVPPGSFLSAVLAADFWQMLSTADSNNARVFHEWGVFLYNDIPALAWGSPGIVATWLERFAKKDV